MAASTLCLFLPLIIFCFNLRNVAHCQDINKSGGKGSTVVSTVVKRVESALGQTNGLLRRTAWVESKFGRDARTYRPGYNGGIWQVDDIGFKDTQNTKSHPRLRNAYNSIQKEFGIDWANVRYTDLRKPLYSGIAARLFYRNKPSAIPSDVAGQARYWKNNYNSNSGAGSKYKFVRDVMAIEPRLSPMDVSGVGDLHKGQKIFKSYGAQCHTIEKGGKPKIGPNLFQICSRSRNMFSAPGFKYSSAAKAMGQLPWNAANLYKFLTNPKKFMPGTKMVFAGRKKSKDVFDLIAYLCSKN